MTNNEKWNKICNYFYDNINQSEDYLQNLWEKLFSEILGYSYLDNEIESKRKIQLGSTERLIPDIIIKKENKDLFIVELKREDLSVNDGRKYQLYSYLKQIHCDLGILICNKIYLIDYNYNTDDSQQISIEIDFSEDNPVGIKFVELFSKDNFDKMKIKYFIKENIIRVENIKKIENELSADLIKNTLIDYFSKTFNKEEISIALNKYKFSFFKDSTETFQANTVIKLTNNQKKEVTPKEKLLKNLKTVGFSTFVKYYMDYTDINNSSEDIKKILQLNENYTENSCATKASTGKGIINSGLEKEALKIIINSKKTDDLTIQKARNLLNES